MSKQKPQRKPPASNSPSAPKAAASASDGLRGIDTNFAVEAAAALISARNSKGALKSGPKKESLEFRMLKEGIKDPGIASIDNLLEKTDGTASKRSSSTPFQENRGQVGHNQTFGPDATRSGVPRRTGG
jgi:hypothetical protein